MVLSPRRRRTLEDEPPLPLPPGPVGTGEFVPAAATGGDAACRALIARQVDDDARRLGLDRRRFLLSAGGVVASLSAFNLAACSGSARPFRGRTATTPARPGTGGTFVVPPSVDLPACQDVLGSKGEFIFDVHTHHVMPLGPWRKLAPATVGLVEGMLPAGCTASDPLDCVDRAAYLHDLFLSSDTTVAMLTDVPNSGPADAPVPFADALGTEQAAAGLTGGGASRVLVQNVIAPNVGALGARLDEMSAAAAGGKLAAFKVYTAWSPTAHGWSLADPAIGLPVVQHAHDLGVRVVVAHKGLPLVNFDPAYNHPDDVVAVSRQFPDMQFVVFHAAWTPARREGPYDAAASVGIDSLLAALDRHGVPPDSNVWVDLGTVWRQVLTDPDQAAHVLGKLLSRVGARRVLWGTDAIWYGSPQPQIMALRAFQITPAYQERFGYPALTDAVKEQIFGLNAAALFGVDPTATRCAVTTDPLTSNQPEVRQLQADQVLPSPWAPNGPVTRRQTLRWLASPATRWLPA
ncbi:MAG TPA: amidohydrolase family protein [Acidimicrobiales bacterium]